MKMKKAIYPELDQNNQLIPRDLVVLTVEPMDLTKDEFEAVNGLAWYEPVFSGPRTTTILVSARDLDIALDGTSNPTQLIDIGIFKLDAVNKIDQCLHRWDAAYFYHA